MENNKPRALGRGLDALFANTTNPQTQETSEVEPAETSQKLQTAEDGASAKGEILYIDINKITPNPGQPRTRFDEDKLNELSASIKLHGLIQPLLVKKIDLGYEIIAGERRWRASRKAGLKQLPCILKEYDEKDLLLVALIENMQRENLNPLEEAAAFQHMAVQFHLTQEEISKNVGKSRPYVSNLMRLLKLPAPIQTLISEGSITTGHARALLGLETFAQQIAMAKEIVKKDLSVRQVEDLVAGFSEKKEEKKMSLKEKHPELFSIEREIKEAIGAQVKINRNKEKDKGKIEIAFYNRDELNRLIELLLTIKE